MKLSGEQRDTLHSLVITQNVSGAIAFVEGLVGGSDGEADVPSAKEPVQQDVRGVGKKKVSDS